MRKIVLLRGVNVGGKNKIKMAELRETLAQFSFTEVQTYIQSGNLILSRVEEFDSQIIEKLIHESFNVLCKAFCFDPDHFRDLVLSCPFSTEDTSKLYFTFLEKETSKAIEGIDLKNDLFKKVNDVVYVSYATKYSDSKLNNSSIEKALELHASTRNWKTCQKIISML